MENRGYSERCAGPKRVSASSQRGPGHWSRSARSARYGTRRSPSPFRPTNV